MDGYLNDKNRVLNEWYQLFIQKRHILSHQDYKHWQHIKSLGLLNSDNKKTWKNNFLKNFLKNSFIFPENTIFDVNQITQLILPIESYRLIFINGQLSKKFSDIIIDPWNIKIHTTTDRYTICNTIQTNIFSYLAECLSDVTIQINLPERQITNKPLYLLYISEGSHIKDKLATSHYHFHINIGNHTNTSIIEHFVSINKNSHFSGIHTSITVGDHAKLHHIKLIFENRTSYNISNYDIKVGHAAHVDSNNFIILGPKFTSHKTNAILNYAESSISLNSLTLLGNTDISYICTYIEHNNKDYALSKQLHKIIADHDSTGIFNGLIKVNLNSMKTDGIMTNNNLLLHQNAKIYSTPKLEIYSDNVSCSHGATIGKIDTDHLFYLITRGIPIQKAIKILIHAFTTEVTNAIQNTLLKKIILKKINNTLTRSIYENISYKKN